MLDQSYILQSRGRESLKHQERVKNIRYCILFENKIRKLYGCFMHPRVHKERMCLVRVL